MTDELQSPGFIAPTDRTSRPGKRPSTSITVKNSHLLACVANPQRTLFLDIETTGLSRYYDELTLVGYAIEGIYRVHIAGDDPTPLHEALTKAATLVTFNGTLFDVPFLKKTFGTLPIPPVHVDLRYASRRVGLVGGQKSIELQIGVSSRRGLEDLDGAAAVLLWHEYLRGDQNALRRLIAYNHADIRGMLSIFDYVLKRMELPADFFLPTTTFADLFPGVEGAAKHGARLPKPARLGRKFTTFQQLFAGQAAASAVVVGIDLTGSEKRPSGLCVLQDGHCETVMVATDQEIIAKTIEAQPKLVSIDSPLSLPKGRIKVTDDDPGRDTYGIMRLCERQLKRRGINVYPCLLPSMQRLTERGMQLADHLRKMGIPVIESYPGAAQDIMGIPRKGAGEALLRDGLRNFGLTGRFVDTPVKHDELDAITSAVVGTFFLAGKFEGLSGPEEGALIVPNLAAPDGPLVIGISGHIGAGKTTAARYFEQQGYAYCRFSQVIDEIILAEGLAPSRATRQNIGWRVHTEKGQRWLCEKTLERAGGSPKIVVDGLRFPEDHAYLVERFGFRFRHIHINAPERARSERLAVLGISAGEFLEAAGERTERSIDLLASLASLLLDNSGTKPEFIKALGVQILATSEPAAV